MQRHLRVTYSQVSHLCRQSLSPVFISPIIGLQGISTSSVVAGRTLLHEILKSSPSSRAGVRVQSKLSSSDAEARTARNISNIDPVLTTLLLTTDRNTIVEKEHNEEKIMVSDETEFSEPPENSVTKSDLESILNQVDLDSITIKQACQVIGRLGALNPKPDLSVLEKDPRFISVCNLIKKGNFTLNPFRLILTTQSLERLGMPATNNIILELRNEMKWVLRRCPIKLLAKAVKSFEPSNKSSHASTASSSVNTGAAHGVENSFEVSVDIMNRRWVETVTGSDFIAVFGISSHLSNDTNEKLEDRAYELVQQFSTMEMVKMVTSLAQQKRRPVPLLKAVAFHLSKTNDVIPVKDSIEMVHALSRINFVDQLLMQKVCLEIAPEVDKITNPALFSSLATALGRSRFKPKELVEAMEEWVDQNFGKMRSFDQASWLLTISVLNVKSELSEKFCKNIKTLLNPNSTSNPIEWLNIVHAFLILNCASIDQLASVLQPQAIEKIDQLSEQFIGPRMKLLNINESLKFMLESEKQKNTRVASLDPNLVIKWSTSQTTQDVSLSNLVLTTLEQFLPPPKYFIKHVRTNSGVFIDAVCAVNSKREPVPVSVQSLQEQKKDVHKIAIVVAGYASLCLGSNIPTGQTSLHERLLRAEKYNVILVPFNEFSSRSTLLQRIKYLETKIKSVSLPVPVSVGKGKATKSKSKEKQAVQVE